MENKNLKYLIVGAGGTGGAVAGYMGKAGKNVTVIARGEHLQAIQKNGGLRTIRPKDEKTGKYLRCERTAPSYQKALEIAFFRAFVVPAFSVLCALFSLN